MFDVQTDKTNQLLTIKYSGRVVPEHMTACIEAVTLALEEMRPGFSLLTDLSALESMDPACAVFVGKLMDLCAGKGIKSVTRIVPDPRKDIGLNILSLIHYGPGVATMTYDNVADALSNLTA